MLLALAAMFFNLFNFAFSALVIVPFFFFTSNSYRFSLAFYSLFLVRSFVSAGPSWGLPGLLPYW
jgi:hypothetical protein